MPRFEVQGAVQNEVVTPDARCRHDAVAPARGLIQRVGWQTPQTHRRRRGRGRGWKILRLLGNSVSSQARRAVRPVRRPATAGQFERLILTNTWAWPLNGHLTSEVFSCGMGDRS